MEFTFDLNRKVILASHGEFSKGLKNSLEMIVGESGFPVDYYGLFPGENADSFVIKIKEEIESNTDTEYIILVDLYGASVANSFLPLSIYENVVIFTGMNLPLLLEIVLKNEIINNPELIERLLKSSRDSIKLLKMDENNYSDVNDF